MRAIEVYFLLAVFAFTVSCFVLDVRTRRIPNWLTVPAFALGLLSHTVWGGLATHSVWGGIEGLKFSLFGFATGFGLLLVLWFIGGSGGGDVKMMAALGTWLGAWWTVWVFVVSGAVALFVVCSLIVVSAIVGPDRRSPKKPTSTSSKASDTQAKASRWLSQQLPYGVHIVISTWLVVTYALRAGALFPAWFD